MSLDAVFKLSLVLNMIDKLSGPMASATSNVGGALSSMNGNFSQACGSAAMVGSAMAASGAAITSAVLAPVEATFETRRAIGELASLGVKDLGVVENAAKSFSDQWAGTTKSDFISAAYDIKSGIASLSDEGVADFTALSGLTAKATKSSIAEMTSLFATGYGIYKSYYSDLSDLEFGEMFSAGISQSVKQFKTTGSGMAQSIQTLGASATTANVPLEEQLSILGMLQATMSGSEAGTKYKAFLRSATKGGEALGLSFTDANNQLLSMPEILDILRGKFGETMDAAEKMELQKAFGDTEAVALIDLMYNKTGDLQTNILGMYDALGSGTGVATEMANAMNQTEPERYEVLTQKIHNLKESIGSALLPTVNDLMEKMAGLLEKAAAWIENHQELVKVIMLVVAGLGAFLTVAGTVITTIAGIGLVVPKAIEGFKLLKSGFILVKGALSPLIASVWSFTSALLANPITWIVIGIVGLVAALVLLYNKCEWFRNLVNKAIDFIKAKLGAAFQFIQKIWGNIKASLAPVVDAVKNAFTAAWELIQVIWDRVGPYFMGIWSAVKSAFSAVVSVLGGVFRSAWAIIKAVWSVAVNYFKLIWTGIKAVFSVVAAVIGGFFRTAWAVVQAIWNVAVAFFQAIFDGIAGVFSFVKAVLSGDFAGAWEAIKGIWSTVTGFFGTVWENIKGVFSAVASWFGGVFSAAWTAVKNVFSGVGAFFKGVWDTIVGLFGSIGTAVGDAISGAVTGAINAVLSGAATIINGFIGAINLAISAINLIPGVNINKLNKMEVPHLAEGGYVGANRPQAVIVGDNKREGEIVSPVSKMQNAMMDTLTRFSADNEADRPKKVGSIQGEPLKKIRWPSPGNGDDDQGNGQSSEGTGASKKVIIQKLLLKVDAKSIRELQQLLKLFAEVEEYVNGNGGDDDVDVEDAEFALE